MNGNKHTVRIAPSPTGKLHLGTLRTAYFNWLIAQQHPDSKFIVRIDDTDLNRSQDDLIQPIFDTLKHYGLLWDRTYKQSDRFHIYRTFANQLLHSGKAKHDDGAIRLDCQDLSYHDLKWNDTITGGKGPVPDIIDSVNTQVIMKSDGSPTYNFASAIDDIIMGVTWVIRGTDHIVNTFKQVRIHNLLYSDLPQYSHVGLLTHMSGKKYSKRDSDQLDLSSYDPDAVLNFILRLGWSPTQDDKSNNIIQKDKAIDLFLDGGKMRAPNCKVDLKKLDWYNKKYNGIKSRQAKGVS